MCFVEQPCPLHFVTGILQLRTLVRVGAADYGNVVVWHGSIMASLDLYLMMGIQCLVLCNLATLNRDSEVDRIIMRAQVPLTQASRMQPGLPCISLCMGCMSSGQGRPQPIPPHGLQVRDGGN